MAIYDFIIVGQGLAGTTLAWNLQERNQRVLVIDPGLPVTSSRIAAGLVTPITGRRFVLSWRYDLFYTAALAFYRAVEQRWNCSLYQEIPHLHLFANPAQQASFQNQKLQSPDTAAYVETEWSAGEQPDFIPTGVQASQGGFVMRNCGQLRVAHFLQQFRQRASQSDGLLEEEVDPDEIELVSEGVQIPRLGVTARQLVFCGGVKDQQNRWFSRLPFLPAKGEILTATVPEWASPELLPQVIHRGVWVAPGAAGHWLVGATYNSRELNTLPTEQGKAEILQRLREFCECSLSVTAHQAAVRPALQDQRPVVGRHPVHPQLAICNGLGSKGSLQAPWLCAHLAEHLCEGTLLDAEVDVQQKWPLF